MTKKKLNNLQIAIPSDADEDIEKEEEFVPRNETVVLKANGRRVSSLTRGLEANFYEQFTFLFVGGPKDGITSSEGVTFLKKLDEGISKMTEKPKFLFICSGLLGKENTSMNFKDAISKNLQKSSVRVICLPGESDRKRIAECDENTSEAFGDLWFSFWVGGVSFLALHSSKTRSDEAMFTEQYDWLASELIQNENSCPKATFVLMEHGPGSLVDSNNNTCEAEGATALDHTLNATDCSHIICTESGETGGQIPLTVCPRISKSSKNVCYVKVLGDHTLTKICTVDELGDL